MKEKFKPINIFPAPDRKPDQKSVLELHCEPIKNVRIAFIGLGMRVSNAIKRFQYIDGVTIVAISDVVKEKVKKTESILKENSQHEVDKYYEDNDWKIICEREDVDLIYVSTHYELHTPIAVYAMQCGKHVAIEVPAASTIEDCWKLIDTAEQTQRHCMMLENCNYGRFELATLNMVQQGVLGEIIHGEGAYIHDLKEILFNENAGYWNMWRLKQHTEKNGNLYPTHGMGPVCHSMGIHRGDKMEYLVSMSTNQFGLTKYARRNFGENSEYAEREYRNGDMNTTIINTLKGKTILLQHDITSPRPYSRIHMLSGTNGFVRKWPERSIALAPDSKQSLSQSQIQKTLSKYEHPVYKQVNNDLLKYSQTEDAIAKNEGMDFIMDYRLIHCLQNGLPLDQDVYDAAEWSAIIELSEYSVNNCSVPVKIPDFTRGEYNKIKKVTYYIEKDK
ncbi:MAG: Gfo/Idh/MocA family oxidoreductase [Bacteroidota bacterium]